MLWFLSAILFQLDPGYSRSILRYGSVAFLLVTGKFMYTKLFRFVALGFAPLVVGMIFRIQHYPGAFSLIVSGVGIVFLLYLTYFLKARFTHWLQFLKLLSVAFFFFAFLWNIRREAYHYELLLLADFLFLVMAQLVATRKLGWMK